MEQNLFERNRSLIKSIFNVDDTAVDMLSFEADRNSVLSMIGKRPFLFHGLLALLSNVLYPLLGLKRRVKNTNDDFVFVSCPDAVFRTKTIGLIAGELKYSIIYLPNFHVKAAIKYHKFFKGQGVKAFFATIQVAQIRKAKKKVR